MSDLLPRIDLVQAPADATDLIVVAHGGSEEASRPAGDWQPGLLRVLRFAQIASEVVPEAAVGLPSVEGWADPSGQPALVVGHRDRSAIAVNR